jgi:arsenate reductase (glutaredoxin)
MEVQVFGVKKSADTRKALRFFSERRIRTHFVDFMERAASPQELRRFAQRFGLEALIDRSSRPYVELGLRSANLSEDRWLDKLAEEPLLIRMPLVRQIGPGAKGLTIGVAEEEWRRWIS